MIKKKKFKKSPPKKNPKKAASKKAAPSKKNKVAKVEVEEENPWKSLIGNEFWKERTRHGRKPIFENPEDLLMQCEKYFIWVINNPLEEEKVFQHEGKIISHKVKKVRAMTKQGLCNFLGISHDTWLLYGKEKKSKDEYTNSLNKGFFVVKERVDSIIYAQKFENASAGLLNANIISRELGLADKKDLTSSDGSMTPPNDFNDFYDEEEEENE